MPSVSAGVYAFLVDKTHCGIEELKFDQPRNIALGSEANWVHHVHNSSSQWNHGDSPGTGAPFNARLPFSSLPNLRSFSGSDAAAWLLPQVAFHGVEQLEIRGRVDEQGSIWNVPSGWPNARRLRVEGGIPPEMVLKGFDSLTVDGHGGLRELEMEMGGWRGIAWVCTIITSFVHYLSLEIFIY
jgi:hypothetical protein